LRATDLEFVGRRQRRFLFSSTQLSSSLVKYTQYFQAMRQRPDRAIIRLDWIQNVVEHPIREAIQQDGRIRRWGAVAEMDGRYLRVILLPDGETVHNAFFDRSFTP
jgi:hypothetical protein